MHPALDEEVFADLVDDLESHATALEFLTSFEALLARRIARIGEALLDQSREETITALLSLSSSAFMGGALQLHATIMLALAATSVELTTPGPLIEQLTFEAALFSAAFITMKQRTPPTAEENEPRQAQRRDSRPPLP